MFEIEIFYFSNFMLLQILEVKNKKQLIINIIIIWYTSISDSKAVVDIESYR